MAKRQIIKGKRLRLLEEIIQTHSDLLTVSDDIHGTRTTLNALREQKKELQKKRDELIREALKKRVPGKQIGERLGLSKVAIHWIKKNDEKTE